MTITTALKNNLDNSMRAAQDVSLGSRLAARGIYTVTAGDDTANTVDIDTGFTGAEGFIVQIMRSGAVATGNAAISLSSGVLTVADGATYVLTAGDVINYLVY